MMKHHHLRSEPLDQTKLSRMLSNKSSELRTTLSQALQPIQGTIHKVKIWSRSITPMNSWGTIDNAKELLRQCEMVFCARPQAFSPTWQNHSRYFIFPKTHMLHQLFYTISIFPYAPSGTYSIPANLGRDICLAAYSVLAQEYHVRYNAYRVNIYASALASSKAQEYSSWLQCVPADIYVGLYAYSAHDIPGPIRYMRLKHISAARDWLVCYMCHFGAYGNMLIV